MFRVKAVTVNCMGSLSFCHSKMKRQLLFFVENWVSKPIKKSKSNLLDSL